MRRVSASGSGPHKGQNDASLCLSGYAATGCSICRRALQTVKFGKCGEPFPGHFFILSVLCDSLCLLHILR
jgi:hypothetical protein